MQADATQLPFPDGSFDAAFSTFTHTDFDDFRGALQEVLRVLRDGGRFVYMATIHASSAPRSSISRPGCPDCIPDTAAVVGGTRKRRQGQRPPAGARGSGHSSIFRLASS